MQQSDLVIIGSGMAAIRLVETLRRRGDRRSITVVGAEPSLPYNRILLSPLLAGELQWQQLISHDPDWYTQQQVDLLLGSPVTTVDIATRTLRCGATALAWRELVFATGSRPTRPAIPGIDLANVCGFRDVADVAFLQKASGLHAGGSGRAVVLGGGLLGLEAAAALAGRGMQVELVHRADRLMNRQLDATAAAYLTRAIAARGVAVHTGVAPAAIVADASGTAAAGVQLADGRLLAADLVVVAIGITPVTELARAAGVPTERGIVVDRGLATRVPGVYAIGECCELNGETVGLVAPIWQQVEVLAARLCGERQRYRAVPSVTMLKVSGIDVHAMGEIEVAADCRALVYEDRDWGIYKKLVVRQGRIVGALLFGDVADSQLFFSLVQQQAQVDRDYCRLLLAGELPADLQLATA